MKLPISEIFVSIDGEGIRTGDIVTFIRLYGCNLRCSYCDSMYAVDNKEELKQCEKMSIKDIINKVEQVSISKKITLTGGEPLLNKNFSISLIRKLLREGYEVNIETNGSIGLGDEKDLNKIKSIFKKKNVIITMDIKCPSSGMEKEMLYYNLRLLNEKDVVKYVVGSEEDLNFMKETIKLYPTKAKIYVSPVFGKIEPIDIVSYLLHNKLINVRIQLQLHKIIWDPKMRGV